MEMDSHCWICIECQQSLEGFTIINCWKLKQQSLKQLKKQTPHQTQKGVELGLENNPNFFFNLYL